MELTRPRLLRENENGTSERVRPSNHSTSASRPKALSSLLCQAAGTRASPRAAVPWRLRSALALLALLAGGCDALTVRPFLGAAMVVDLDAADPTPSGQHLELWGRDAADNVLRIGYRLDGVDLYGFQLRLAVDPTDPCLINDTGYLLTDPAAYPGDVDSGGVRQTPAEQAQQVINKIRQITSVSLGGMQSRSLLLVVPVDATPWPALPPHASAAERLAACKAYWSAGPYSYSPNPLQFGQPLHGATLGPVNYSTTSPMYSAQDIFLDSPLELDDLQELWMTVESVPPEEVDATRRGPTWMQGPRSVRGRSVLNFDMTGAGVSGQAAIILQKPPSAF